MGVDLFKVGFQFSFISFFFFFFQKMCVFEGASRIVLSC